MRERVAAFATMGRHVSAWLLDAAPQANTAGRQKFRVHTAGRQKHMVHQRTNLLSEAMLQHERFQRLRFIKRQRL
jgi:hypothetical protein